MSAKDVFEPSRLWCLARLQWQEQWRTWGAFTLALALLLALVAVSLLLGGSKGALSSDSQVVIYYMGLALSGYILTLPVFSLWRTRGRALNYLMLPSSGFEKWLFSMVLLLVILPVIYTLIFSAIFSVGGSIAYANALVSWQALPPSAQNCMPAPKPQDFATYFIFRASSLRLPIELVLYLFYVGLVSFAATGLVFFRRFAAIKTFVLGFALLIIFLTITVSLHVDFRPLTEWLQPRSDYLPLGKTIWVFIVLFWFGAPALLLASSFAAQRERDLV